MLSDMDRPCIPLNLLSLPFARAGAGAPWWRQLFLPTHRFSLVLFVQPLLQRREVLQDRAGINLPAAGQRFQRVGPGFALAHGEHLVELRSGFLRPVEGAAV